MCAAAARYLDRAVATYKRGGHAVSNDPEVNLSAVKHVLERLQKDDPGGLYECMERTDGKRGLKFIVVMTAGGVQVIKDHGRDVFMDRYRTKMDHS